MGDVTSMVDLLGALLRLLGLDQSALLPAIALLLRAVVAGKLANFAYYCWIVGGISLAFTLMGH